MVLALVLGIVSLASAGLTLDPSGSGSDTSVEIIGAGNGTAGAVTFASIQGAATESSFSFVYAGTLKAITDFTGVDPDLTNGIEFYAGGAVDKIYFLEFFDGTDTPPSADGLLATWGLTVGDTLNLHDADSLEVVDSYTVVPEPATMGLLGLGVLLLRRKK